MLSKKKKKRKSKNKKYQQYILYKSIYTQKVKFRETENIFVVAQGWRWEKGFTVNGHEEFYCNENVPKLDCGDVHLCKFTENH